MRGWRWRIFCTVPRGEIALNLKSPEIDRKGSERIEGAWEEGFNCYQFVSKDSHYFQHKCFVFWALCKIMSMWYWVVFRWEGRRYFTFGEKKAWWLIFSTDWVDSLMGCMNCLFSSPPSLCLIGAIPLISRHQGKHVLLAGDRLHVCLELPPAFPEEGGWCGWKGDNAGVVVKVLSWFPVHTRSRQKSQWGIKNSLWITFRCCKSFRCFFPHWIILLNFTIEPWMWGK